MCHDMIMKIEPWITGKEDPPHCLMITGAGEKAFCAGGDVVGLYNAGLGLAG